MSQEKRMLMSKNARQLAQDVFDEKYVIDQYYQIVAKLTTNDKRK
jgi:hypothetical protein